MIARKKFLIWFSVFALAILFCVTAYGVLRHQSVLQDYSQRKDAQTFENDILTDSETLAQDHAVLKNAKGALIFQSLDYGSYEKSLIVIDALSGDKIVIPNTVYGIANKSRLVGRSLFSMEKWDSITQYDIDTEMKTVHTLTGYKSEEGGGQWNLVDFVVGIDKIVYRLEGPWPTDDESQDSKPCMIRQKNLRDDSDVEIMRIKDCFAAHGPSYVFEGISSDGSTLTLHISYGESGYSSIELYEINLETKAIEVKEVVTYNAVCDEGTFYNPTECAPEVKTKNEEYDAFRKRHKLFYGWTENCGDSSITKNENQYDDFSRLLIQGKSKQYEIDSAEYLGCLR